ncbi:MAG: EAL domain-containing protein [Methylobacteriaceae bacterium]|nr:EAL domain-containing protein [Methylobacteriaceae bacterium]
MTGDHPLLARQLRRARGPDGALDIERLLGLVVETYEEYDRERRRTDHSIRMMVEELDHRAEHDALTGLANRARFANALQGAIRDAQGAARAAVLFLDLDRFKEVNDSMGHAAGDELLRAVARRLLGVVGARGVAARLGGDEFAVVQHRIDDPVQAAELAHELVRSLSETYDIEGARVDVGVSVGISILPDHGRAAHDLQRRADMALYRAKQGRLGAFCFFEPEMDEALTSRKALESALREAMASDILQLHLQPIVEAVTGRVASYEALLRWPDPERGYIPPSEFIPIAETTGLIVPIGDWVVRRACEIVALLPGDVGLSINLSPVQLRSDNLVQVFEEALAATGVAPHRLEVEITESALLGNDRRTMRMLDRLRAIGLRFALDDFGTGYSSLSYLQQFRFDTIKIDRSFCASVDADPTNAALVRAVAALGRDLGMAVVAEGVEEQRVSDALIAEGCQFLQGYHYGRPAPPEKLVDAQGRDALRGAAAVRRLRRLAAQTHVAPALAGARRVV